MERSEQINELATALAKAQGEIKGAVRDTANPFFKSKYADLASVWEACRTALTSNGLAVVQALRAVEGGVEVLTMLLHASGQWVSESLAVPAAKQDAQGFGSAVTYARRYGLAAMVGVAPEDDDGNAAAASKPTEALKVAPAAGVFESLAGDQQIRCQLVASLVVDAFNAGNEALALQNWTDKSEELDPDEKVAAWNLLPSKHRSTLKRMTQEKQLRAMGQT